MAEHPPNLRTDSSPDRAHNGRRREAETWETDPLREEPVNYHGSHRAEATADDEGLAERRRLSRVGRHHAGHRHQNRR